MKKSTTLKASLDTVIEKLITAIESESVTQELKDFYKQASRFTNYSLHNQVLIMMQDPKATRVAGYKAWPRLFSRYVKKGEHGISILAPHMYKTEENGKVSDHVGFHATTIFDVRQTDGKPLEDPTHVVGEDGEQLYNSLVSYGVSIGMQVLIVDDLGLVKGSCSRSTIKINNTLPMQNRVGVLVHELAHRLAGHHDKDLPTNIEEYEAESVSFIVCDRFRIRNKAPQYLKGWGATRKDIKSSLGVISDISSKIINEIVKTAEKDEHDGN